MLKPKLKSVFSEGYRKTINTKLYTSLIVSGNKHREQINHSKPWCSANLLGSIM